MWQRNRHNKTDRVGSLMTYLTSSELGLRWRQSPRTALQTMRRLNPSAIFKIPGSKGLRIYKRAVLDIERNARGCGLKDVTE